MKNYSIIFLLIAIFIFENCSNTKNKNKNVCEEAIIITNDLINDFYYDNDSTHLDSAIVVIENAICDCDDFNEKQLILRKISVLSLLNDYAASISYIESLDAEIFNNFPYSKGFLQNRFLAMQFQYEGDTIKRDFYINNCIFEIENILNNNKNAVDSIFQLNEIEKVLNDSLTVYITQYYYYRSIIEGYNNIDNELFQMMSENKLNPDFYDYLIINLELDFLIFIGL